jgi:predicted enzyme related to lactoylglutathione lyase
MLVVAISATTVAQNSESSAPSQTEEAKVVPKNPVAFWELASSNSDKSAEFFRRVFDWKVEFSEDLGFYQVPATEGANASGGYIFTLKQARLPFLTIYIVVSDIEARAEKVKEFGGEVIEPPHEMPGGYWICLFNEPSGVTFAMIQPKHQAK